MSSNALEDYLTNNLNTRHLARKNGRIIDKDGYVLRFRSDHHFADCKSYVREHRLVWEYYNKAILLPWAVVHHINHKRNDNRIENLQIMNHQSQHAKNYYEEQRNNVLSKRHCVICNSNKTYIVNHRGHKETQWCFLNHDKDKPVCGRCIQRKNILALSIDTKT